MSDISPDQPERVGNRGGWGKKRKNWTERWGHLPERQREQYLAIEARVQEKVKRGEL